MDDADRGRERRQQDRGLPGGFPTEPEQSACAGDHDDASQPDDRAGYPSDRHRLMMRPRHPDKAYEYRGGRIEDGRERAVDRLLAECNERVGNADYAALNE